MSTNPTEKTEYDEIQPLVVSGNFLFFHAFDVGDEIELEKIETNGLVKTHKGAEYSFFKNYTSALGFVLDTPSQTRAKLIGRLYNYGVLSLYYRVPFSLPIEKLKMQLIYLQKFYDVRAALDGGTVFEQILPAVRLPNFYNMHNSFVAIQLNPSELEQTPAEFKVEHGSLICSMLRLGDKVLSAQQQNEILSSSSSYFWNDLVIVDDRAAVIFNDEYDRAVEFFESTNIQKLELRYFDQVLNTELTRFYQKEYKIPFRSYIPLIGRHAETPITKLARLRVDISVITERIESSISLSENRDNARLYQLLVERLHLGDHKEVIRRKLDIIWDLYTVYQNQLDMLHSNLLEIVIILLIMLEAYAAFMR